MAIGAAGALLTLVPSLPAIVAGLALCATGVFIAQATASSYIGAVTTQDRALAVGLYSTFYYAGGSVGGALPAALWTPRRLAGVRRARRRCAGGGRGDRVHAVDAGARRRSTWRCRSWLSR